MKRCNSPWCVAVIAMSLVGLGKTARADFEADLLQKFQRQNQNAAGKAREIVEKNLAQALGVSAQNPEKALELLRQGREALHAADALPRDEKTMLARKLDDGFRDARARMQSKEEESRRLAALAKPAPTPAKTAPTPRDDEPRGRISVSPILLQPNIIAAPQSAAGTVTPVVSPDRRWVRIGVSAGFSVINVR